MLDRRTFVKGGLAAAVAVAVPWRDDGVVLGSIVHPPGNRLIRADDLSEESLERLLIQMAHELPPRSSGESKRFSTRLDRVRLPTGGPQERRWIKQEEDF